MATKKKATAKTAEDFLSAYMMHCLEEGKAPASVYAFTKSVGAEESDFYALFGSLESLDRAVWVSFFDQTLARVEKGAGFEAYTPRDKWLSFFYTFFELLTLNRSYVLMALQGGGMPLERLEKLSGLRKKILGLQEEWAPEMQSDMGERFSQASSRVVSEGLWLQLLFLMRFWMKDESRGFEKTDMAIEKSVQTFFDLADTAPVERLVDFGKFLFREHFATRV